MLASISPLGERGRNHSWWATFAWYAAGALAGGTTVGVAAGGLGALLRAALGLSDAVAAAVALFVGTVAIVFELRPRHWRLPTVVRQVDEDWIGRYRVWLYAGGFGYQLGLGVVTIVMTAAVYLTWLLAALTGSVVAGAVVGASFGAARALPLLLVADADTPDVLRRRVAGFHRAEPAARRAAFVAVVAVPLVAALALIAGGWS